jgi:hypothetical protein
MPVNEQVVDAVTATNFKAIAEANAVAMNLSVQNAVSNQQAMNQIQQAAVGKIVELLVSTDVSEAAGLSVLAQQASKTAGNTPPVTP